MDKGKINEKVNLSDTNVKPGGAGLGSLGSDKSVTTKGKVALETAKNNAKNTWVKNSGNKGGASTHSV